MRNLVVVRPTRLPGGEGEYEGFRRKAVVGWGGKMRPTGLTPDME